MYRICNDDGLFNGPIITIDYRASNVRMMREEAQRNGRDVEGSSRSIFSGTVPGFVWRD
jgi:hypothetical protein